MRSDIGRLLGLGVVLAVFSGLTLATILLAGANFLVIGIFALLAWFLIAMLFDDSRDAKRRPSEAAKVKRLERPASDAELIARLLDPQDIEEIKDAIRERLLDSVESDGEVVGLEDLLASQRRRKTPR
ncbi:MAG TPA: hypothetical protein PKX07_12950 [Aggregatilineales bacterium]|nr:hypothetical protein [Aggregatilineales bacterium]